MMLTELPDAAKAKFTALQLARGAAEDAARAAVARINNLSPYDADQEQLRAALTVEADKQRSKHAALAQLVNKIQQWVFELPGNTSLEAVQIADVELAPNETLQQAVSNVQAEIAMLRERLGSIRRAPLPVADQRQLVGARSRADGAGDRLS
jgi:hypothetical protein